jgi:hypothetical protein
MKMRIIKLGFPSIFAFSGKDSTGHPPSHRMDIKIYAIGKSAFNQR